MPLRGATARSSISRKLSRRLCLSISTKKPALCFVSSRRFNDAPPTEGQHVVAFPFRKLALYPFHFPFSREALINDALKLRFKPILGAKENDVRLSVQTVRREADETFGTAWIISKSETEECEKDFDGAVVWPAPYLFASRVNGNGAVICSYEDGCCGMLFVKCEPELYLWLSAEDGGEEKITEQLLSYAGEAFPETEFAVCRVSPDTAEDLQQIGEATVRLCEGARKLDLSSRSRFKAAETSMRKLHSLLNACITSGIIFALLSLVFLAVNLQAKQSFVSAPRQVCQIVFGKSPADPLSFAAQTLSAADRGVKAGAFCRDYSRVASALRAAGDGLQINELNYSAGKMRISGKASQASSVDAFKKALSDAGYGVSVENVRRNQSDNLNFVILLTEKRANG